MTILDLRGGHQGSGAGLTDLSRVIVLGGEWPAFGILADAARGLLAVDPSDVRGVPEGLPSKGEYLRGMTGDAVMVLDAERLLRLYG